MRCIAGRYELRSLLGRGGHGEVWEAEDTLTRTLVAVKLLGEGPDIEAARVRREVSALRLLRIPGVVQLLDEGVDGGRPFLVMERAHGGPFPGGDGGQGGEKRPWERISAVTMALLDTLSRVHATGVVHRDLKPGNVLVDEHGRPTILDFGLSFGASLGEGLTGDGRILGTPHYLAPEQIVGDAVTPATDIYAIGVMLYGVLAGRLPHETGDFQTLMRMRLTETPVPLRDLAPEVPLSVARVIDALLAREPEDRPGSADEVLARLREEPLPSRASRGPYLGDDSALVQVLGAARRGRSIDIAGLPGTGRTRCLQEVAGALAGEGVDVLWTVPGKRPFSSLEPLIAHLSEQATPSLAEVQARVDQALAELLGGGTVIAADDWSRLDRWSVGAVERARDRGAVIRVVEPGPGDPPVEREDRVLLQCLREEDLRRLFAGPDRIFHLREDAARELFLRTGGLASLVFSELGAWERAGLSQRVGSEDSVWSVGRDAIEKLSAGRMALPPRPAAPGEWGRGLNVPRHLEDLVGWIELSWPHTRVEDLSRILEQPSWRLEAETEELLQLGAITRLPDGRMVLSGAKGAASRWRAQRRKSAHRAIAKAISKGGEGRLFHLIAGQSERDAGDPAEVVNETLALAEPMVEEGRLGCASALLADGLLAARRGSTGRTGDWGEGQLLGLWTRLALSEGTPRALDRVLYELCRVSNPTEDVRGLTQLVRAALAMRTAAGDRALSLVDEIGAFARPELERWRQQVRVQSARLCSIEREAAVIDEVERWARAASDTDAEASTADWIGRLRYRQGLFDEAAEHHARAVAGQAWMTERIGALLNRASALLEAFRFDEAALAAEQARVLAAQCRHAYCEARAEWLRRSATYRRGDSMVVDRELLELVAKTGVLDLEALVCLSEAAIAWQGSDWGGAAALSRRAQEIWTGTGKRWGALFARSLALGATGTTAAEALELAEEAIRCPVPGAGIQMLGFLARACPEVACPLEPAMISLRSAIPERIWPFRMDVLSAEESLALVRAAS
ncbi:MAG: serine/threonine-protein kinase [Polyangiaceae bacterium]